MQKIAYIQIEDGAEIGCLCPPEVALDVHSLCVAEVDGLMEFGKVARIETHEQPPPATERKLPRIVRRATLQDQSKAHETQVMGRMAKQSCIKKAAKFKLPMRLVRVRYNFDRTVLMVMFTAEDRMDFREMVRELSGELSARIEMKQVGVRDEAAILGGMGPCGRELCCCSWLKQFAAVNVKVVKTQGISLNPSAITGMCGRLKCCLRYEYDVYRELSKHLPRLGSTTQCPDGRGIVVAKDVLKQRVCVRLEDHRVLEYRADELEGFVAEKHDDDGRITDEAIAPERSELEPVG